MQKKKYKGYTLRNIGTPTLPAYGIFNKSNELVDRTWFPSEFKGIVDRLLK